MNPSKMNLAHLPTRIEELPRLSQALGGPQILCKRDDQTGLGFGGNKTRKLEYLLAEAFQNGARTLITTGAIQSNHCRQTAALAARMGFNCILVLSGEEPEKRTGNLYLDTLFGAEVVWVSREDREQKLLQVFEQARTDGRDPYLIPYGASNALGMQGYVEAMQEIVAQNVIADWIVVASSSGGTQAGMLLGSLLHGFHGRIVGISVDSPADDLRALVLDLVHKGAEKLDFSLQIPPELVIANDDYLGGGYAVLGDREIEAIRMFASLEGLLLDPVYTGRAAAGLIDLIRQGFFRKQDRVLFWHTGGTPVLFAEPYLTTLQ
jgi:D-cysteine desulfhydrase family pyridoxal phosphate-dependent enzyme